MIDATAPEPTPNIEPAPKAPSPVDKPIPALPEATEGSVIVPGADGANNIFRPIVDPNAFVIGNN